MYAFWTAFNQITWPAALVLTGVLVLLITVALCVLATIVED